MYGHEDPHEFRHKIQLWLGVFLILVGLSIGLWVVTVVHDVLYEPSEVAIVSMLRETLAEQDIGVEVEEIGDGVRIHGANAIFLVLIGGFLLGALGGIVKALITGGAGLVGGRVKTEKKSKTTSNQG